MIRDPEASAATCARVRTPLEKDDDKAALALWVEGVIDIMVVLLLGAGTRALWGGGEGESSITITSRTRPVLRST